MGTTLRLGASLLATVALALVAATAGAAANQQTTYTCTKKKHGQTEVLVSVAEAAVGGLTNAGFICVAETPAGDDQGEEQGDQGNGQGDEQGDQGDEQGDSQNDEQGDSQSEEQGEDETTEENPGSDAQPQNDAAPEPARYLPSTVNVEPPADSRSLFCSTHGPLERGNGDGPGIALNLPGSEGSLLVEQGAVTRAIFYEGIGASCDVLPGFTYSGHWVDNVGEVVPGVAVYPYYVHVPSS